MRTLAICITLVLHHSYPHVYVQLHLNYVLNATPNIAATSLLCTFLKSIQHYYSLEMILGKEAFCHLTCFRDIIVT
jgi:hypothetical protein